MSADNLLNVNVLVAAKEEYLKQLIYDLSPEIYTLIYKIYEESQDLPKKRSISLRNFQILLKKIQLWNETMILDKTKFICDKIPYLMNLVSAIFVTHIKILSCIKLNNSAKKIEIIVPKLELFLHRILMCTAEKIYKNPLLISEKKDYLVSLISNYIEDAIRNQIPIEKILNEYLCDLFDNSNNDDSSNQIDKLNEYDNNLNNLTEIDKINESHELDEPNEIDEIDEIDEPDDSDELYEPDLIDEEDEIEQEKEILPTRPLPKYNLEPKKKLFNDAETNSVKKYVSDSDSE